MIGNQYFAEGVIAAAGPCRRLLWLHNTVTHDKNLKKQCKNLDIEHDRIALKSINFESKRLRLENVLALGMAPVIKPSIRTWANEICLQSYALIFTKEDRLERK